MRSAAKAPLPAPNSTSSRAVVAARIGATCAAKAWANNGVVSGAVTKSPAPPNLRVPAT